MPAISRGKALLLQSVSQWRNHRALTLTLVWPAGNAALISRDCANRWLGELTLMKVCRALTCSCRMLCCLCHADNIEALKGWCKTRFQGMENQLESFFEEVCLSEGSRIECLPEATCLFSCSEADNWQYSLSFWTSLNLIIPTPEVH